VIDGFKGVIDFYVWCGIPCARTWPRPPSEPRSKAVKEQWPVFKAAANTWHLVSPVVQQAYRDMAAGTNMTAKDIYTRGFINGTLRYYMPVDDYEETTA